MIFLEIFVSCQKNDLIEEVSTSGAIAVAVGDYYYDDNSVSTTYDSSKNAIGIVYWIDPNDATKGKIISLDDKRICPWSTEFERIKDARSDINGKANTDAIKTTTNYSETLYPAVWWCDAKNTPAVEGIRWYLPAKDELIYIYTWYNANKADINTIITAAGGTTLGDEFYWSSTEYDYKQAWYVGFSMGTILYEYKNVTIRIRAISSF